MNDFLAFALIVIVHEAGHYLGYKSYGKDPDFRAAGLNLYIGGNVIYGMTIRQVLFVALAGVSTGFMAGVLLNIPMYVWVIYAICCSNDLSIIFSNFGAKNMEKTYLQSIKDDIAEVEGRM